MERTLNTRRLVIADITSSSGPFHPTEFYNDITELVTINKRTSSTKLDNIQIDFGAFHPYSRQLKLLQEIKPEQLIVVTWEPGCRMAYHTTAQPPSQ